MGRVRIARSAACNAGAVPGDAHPQTATLHLELADLVVREALEELGDERVRVGADFAWIRH
jgi:hypothetical protein